MTGSVNAAMNTPERCAAWSIAPWLFSWPCSPAARFTTPSGGPPKRLDKWWEVQAPQGSQPLYACSGHGQLGGSATPIPLLFTAPRDSFTGSQATSAALTAPRALPNVSDIS